jgi:hypothetical protein
LAVLVRGDPGVNGCSLGLHEYNAGVS